MDVDKIVDLIAVIAKKDDGGTLFQEKKSFSEYFDILVQNIDEITKKDNFNIFDEQHVSDVLQLLYSHKLIDNRAKKIQAILEANCHVSQIDVNAEKEELYKFISAPQNKVVTDEGKMDEFVKHLGNLKLANYRILNQGFIDFVLKQALLKNSAISKNPDKYQGLIERCIEDLGRNDLPAKISQDDYVYLIRDRCSQKNTVGLHSINAFVMLKRKKIEDFINDKSLDVLEILYHENTHVTQKFDFNHAILDTYSKYLIAKEEFLLNYDFSFYNANYTNIFKEIYARMQGITKVVKFLDRIQTNDIGQTELDYIRETFLSESRKRLSKEQLNLKVGRFKINTFKDGRVTKVDDLFDRLILDNPEWMEKYTKFRAEYHDTGILKRISDMLPEIDSISEKSDRMFYLKLLKNGNCFKPKNLPKDLHSLMNYEIKNSQSVYVIALIIYQNVPRMIERIHEIPDKRLVDLYREIDSVHRRVEEIMGKPKDELTYTEMAILLGMTKVDRVTSKSALSVLIEKQEVIKTLVEVRNQSAVLAMGYYETSEGDRDKMMADLVGLGFQNQQSFKIVENSKEKDLDKNKGARL